MRRPRLPSLAAVATLLSAMPALAAQSDFTRVVQASRLTQGDFASALSVESQGSLVALSGSSESIGSGSGTGMYRGLTYRAYGHYGVTDWLSLGVEPTVKEENFTTFTLATIVPELRVRLVNVPALPVEVSA